ncbi:hypothetical protein DVH24_035877 [Malus domestica]|uniref:Uncharacterized protein n=1 Tax=Malus domestica TaxID=3750 RepID=A0A498JMM6_MALDO|nr:hypothetical protein DVH24_035877 [Malus domestica]
MLKAEECLRRERDRVSHYLHPSSEQKLVEKVGHELLAKSKEKAKGTRKGTQGKGKGKKSRRKGKECTDREKREWYDKEKGRKGKRLRLQGMRQDVCTARKVKGGGMVQQGDNERDKGDM